MRTIFFLFIFAFFLLACNDEKLKDSCYCTEEYDSYHDANSNWIIIPNVFTPNGDGINDIFYVHTTTSKIDEFSVVVKDGQKVVFSSNDPEFQWDGRINEQDIRACKNYDYLMDVTFSDGTIKQFQNKIAVFNYGFDGPSNCPENLEQCEFASELNPSNTPGIPSGETFECK
jgi:gliding motility-associated-like protein